MCGIVGAVAHRDVPGILLAGLQRLEYRGYDSAGIAVQIREAASIDRRRTLGKVAELVEDVKREPMSGHSGIAHTRWATHGAPSEQNAHPHISSDRICLVHNGIIENFESLRDELKGTGREFTSETDSEVIVHLVDSYYEESKDLLRAVKEAIQRLEGAYAIGVMCRDDPGRIVAARLGSPLVVGVGIGEHYIASDVLALRPVTDRFIYLEEGDLVDITADALSFWNVEDESVIRTSVRVQVGTDEADKGSYRLYMHKEIHEQPVVIGDTLNSYISPELCFEFKYFAIRKMHFLMRAAVLVAFPGGFGTMDELFEALTLVQTGKIQPLPIILFGEKYWRSIVDFEQLVAEGMISPEDLDLFIFVETVEEAWQKIAESEDL
jgi:glucosamine--fructose-6-phosphate aminotransferase (isomerizing)